MAKAKGELKCWTRTRHGKPNYKNCVRLKRKPGRPKGQKNKPGHKAGRPKGAKNKKK